MKKAIVAVLAVILAGVVCIPFASGLVMEKTIRKAFTDLNDMYADTGAGYRLEIVDYHRGYLASNIEWKVDLGALKNIYPIQEVIFKDTAKHGFAGVVSTTSLRENPWYETFVAEKLQGRDPVHITTRYGLTGSIESTVVLDPFSVVVDNETIDVQAGSMATKTDSELKHFTSSGNWAGLSAGEAVSIGQTSLESELTRFTTFVWNGDFSFAMRDVNIHEKQNSFEMKEMKGSYLLGLNEDRSKINGEALFSIDGIKTDRQTVDKASVRLAANGLDVEGYETFMQMYTQNMSQVLGSMAAMDENSEEVAEAMKKQMAAVGLQMIAAYEKMLKQGLEFKVSDLDVQLDNGQIKGDMTLRLLKDMTFMQFAPVVSQPELLFDIFYLKSNLSLPEHLIGENPKLLAPLYPGMQTGLFVKNGGNLVHAAETIDGKLMLNNREMILSPQNL
ncbi:DUF945 family protein [uncultured Desulfosarcina sp.]|uniref:DUF945 family protein n=1 Tax=uncultured Desulfosarcina sp. TaxID=218289 RepID=UPI0029C6848B|nr:DUF945 family protein [uncultured Desulfosarcina sp.]